VFYRTRQRREGHAGSALRALPPSKPTTAQSAFAGTIG
jgi:hypothetical protein